MKYSVLVQFPYYTTSENFDSPPDIQFTYTHNSGAKSQILTSVWSRVVTITIQYNMINQLGSIIWSPNIPHFYVSDGSDAPITGLEISIPSSLTNFALPVELTSFTAAFNQSTINLKWETKTEINNYGFEVERSLSTENKQWDKIGFIPGHGNSNSPKDYSFVDKNPSGGSKFIYRLKQIDNDGKFEYSDEVEIELVPNEFNLFQNYPNSFNPSTKIRFSVPIYTKVSIQIYNQLGEVVVHPVNNFYEAGNYAIEINLNNLASGVYIYKISADNFSDVKKMVLTK